LRNQGYSLSDNITAYLLELYGEEAVEKYSEYIQKDAEQFIRVNSIKTNRAALKKKLSSLYKIETEEVEAIPNALRVLSNHSLTGKTIEHITGEYYVQSLSSMIPALVLQPGSSDRVLDLCSAPGSKTTQLAGLMQNKGTLVVNEIQLDRVKTLVYNLDRMNIMNTGVHHNRGEWLSRFYNNYFDKILVDAPCSGLGIMQKKGEVGNWWSEQKLPGLAELQYKLLVSALRMLKEGGELVYSTCTMTVEENEAVIDKLIKKYPFEILPVELPLKSIDALTQFRGVDFHPSIKDGRRLIPWEIGSEGFFLIKIRKTGFIEQTAKPEISKSRLSFTPFKDLKIHLTKTAALFGIPLDKLPEYKYILKSNDIFFVDGGFEDDNPDRFNRIGTKFGTFDKNKEIIFHTQAAQVLADTISGSIYDITSMEELKSYLQGGIIKKESGLKGQTVIRFNGVILGTAVIGDSGIKSRFPRAKRTQEIFLDF